MVMLFLLGMWALYFWLARKCPRKSTAGARAERGKARQRPPRVRIPDTVPSEWMEAYGAENEA